MSTPAQRENRGLTPVGFEADRDVIDNIERAIVARRTKAGKKVTKAMVYRHLLERFANNEEFRALILHEIENPIHAE